MNKFYLAILGALITGMIIFSVWITTTSFISSETNPTIADKEEKEENPYAYQKVPENFKIAFIGDQGLGSKAKSVLELIKNEGTGMVIHQGDFDYADSPEEWNDQINTVLGSDFPYFASVGNHDVYSWSGYQQKLEERLDKVDGVVCDGDLGVKSSCNFHGIFFILSGVGTIGSGHADYIKNQLGKTESVWRICSWHKNMNAMQVGSKPDDTGWEVYEECRKGGAIVATGHEHSYSRTKTLLSIENQTVDSNWNEANDLRVAEGATFVFVSGLGGKNIREQQRCDPEPPYGCNGEWASIYSKNQNASFGALFCSFNANGKENRANCYFKDIDGNIPDEFSVTSFVVNTGQ